MTDKLVSWDSLGERRHMDSVHDANCARPDCHLEGTAEPDTKEWFVDRIIGRRPQAGDNVRRADPEFLWLVKWDGYVVLRFPLLHALD